MGQWARHPIGLPHRSAKGICGGVFTQRRKSLSPSDVNCSDVFDVIARPIGRERGERLQRDYLRLSILPV